MIVKIKNLRYDGVGDGTLVLGLEPRHPFRQNTKHVDVQVLSDVINIYIQNKIHQNIVIVIVIVTVIIVVVIVTVIIVTVIIVVVIIVVVIMIINDFAVVLHGSKPDQHLASKTAARSHSILLPKGSIHHHHHRRHRCRRCRCLRRRRRHRCIIIIIAVVIIKARAHSKVLPKSSNHDRWG